MKSQTILPFKLDLDTDKNLTRFAGLPLVAETFRGLGLMEECNIRLDIKKRDRGLTSGEMVESLILMLAAGGECLKDLDIMRADMGLSRLIGYEFPAPGTAWKFLNRFNEQAALITDGVDDYVPEEGLSLYQLGLINRDLVRRVVDIRGSKVATLDIDAKIIKSRKQEAKWTYKGDKGYQPITAVWAELGLIVGDEFRDGNVRAGHGVKKFYETIKRRLPTTVEKIRVRSDSAAYEHKFISQLVEDGTEFTISADMSTQLRDCCKALPEEAWQPLDEDSRVVRMWAEVPFVPEVPKYRYYQKHDRYIAYRVVTKQGELFADGSQVKYFAIVTNMSWRGDRLIRWHWEKAGTIEHIHDVLCNELGAGVVPSKYFGMDAAYFRLNVICHNILQAMKLLALGTEYRYVRPKRLRFELLCLAGRIAESGRQIKLYLSTALVNCIELYHKARDRLAVMAV